MPLKDLYRSPIGTIYLQASEKGLTHLLFKSTPNTVLSGSNPSHLKNAKKHIALAKKQLSLYFKGWLKKFDVPLDLAGTPFELSVWKALKKISYGKTCSYQNIARAIKNPKAVRAVGSANGKNNICIILPCHRVIASDGSIGGYSGGIAKKIKLLKLEKSFTRI